MGAWALIPLKSDTHSFEYFRDRTSRADMVGIVAFLHVLIYPDSASAVFSLQGYGYLGPGKCWAASGTPDFVIRAALRRPGSWRFCLTVAGCVRASSAAIGGAATLKLLASLSLLGD